MFVFFAKKVLADISQGGDYTLLESDISNGGGNELSQGDYWSKGSIGQNNSEGETIKGGIYSERPGFYNPARFTYQKPVPINFANSSIKLFVPANSVEMQTFDLYINENTNDSLNAEKIKEANAKMLANNGILSIPLKINEIYFMDEEEIYTKELKNPGEIRFPIKDIDNDGNVDGSNPPIRISTIRGYELDPKYSLWLKSFDNYINSFQSEIVFKFTKPGIYGLFGSIDDSVKDVYAFPVPFRPNGPNSGIGTGKTGLESEGITFANIPQTGKIEIYTIDGRLVKKIDIPLNLSEPKIKWDVKNEAGEKVASGVYIWRVVSGKNSKTGKLVIIR